MTFDEIMKEWRETAGRTEGKHEFHQRLITRQNLIFKLLVHIARELKKIKGESK